MTILPKSLTEQSARPVAYDVDTVRAAIRHFRSDSRFHFAFAGAGPRRNALESFCAANQAAAHVSFSGYRSRHQLAEAFGACHIGLVTQKPETCGSVVPSKTYGLMAAGTSRAQGNSFYC